MQPNRHGWLSIRGSARQGKMQHKQGRAGPSVPAMLEVAVHGDGGLGRPARWEGRLRLAAMQATKTSGNVVLPVFSKTPSTNVHPRPRFSGSRNPLHPAYLPLHSAPSGAGSPFGLPKDLHLLYSPVPANPAGFRPDGALPLGTDVPVRRPANGRWAPPALTPGATLEVTHVHP